MQLFVSARWVFGGGETYCKLPGVALKGFRTSANQEPLLRKLQHPPSEKNTSTNLEHSSHDFFLEISLSPGGFFPHFAAKTTQTIGPKRFSVFFPDFLVARATISNHICHSCFFRRSAPFFGILFFLLIFIFPEKMHSWLAKHMEKHDISICPDFRFPFGPVFRVQARMRSRVQTKASDHKNLEQIGVQH